METALDLLAWRAALPNGPAAPEPQALLDAASRCRAAGAQEAARLLFEAAYLRLGCSPQRRAEQAALALWSDAAVEPPPLEPAGGTIGIAMGELRSLARRLGDGPSLDPAPEPIPDRGTEPEDVACTMGALLASLRAPEDGAALDTLGRALARFGPAGSMLLKLDYRCFATAPLDLLTPAVAVASLRAFLGETRDLRGGPFGSPALLHRAARFSSFGLGPWFGNVGLIARSSRDLFELARLAQRAGNGRASVLAWVVLLSRSVMGALLNEVIDDLGDLGAGDALTAILARQAARPEDEIDQAVIRRIRDAGLDNLDYDLAAQAQAVLVRLEPGRLLERRLLGTIQASGGDRVTAAYTFRDCLEAQPGDEHLRTLLAAARADAFAPHAVRRGWESPPGRQEFRIARRGDGPAARPRVRTAGSGPARVEFY